MNVNNEQERTAKRGIGKGWVAVIAFVVALTAFFGGALFGSANHDLIAGNGGTGVVVPGNTDRSDFDRLFQVRDILEERYYQDFDIADLVEGAIKGMVNAIGDPYTVFFNEEEYKTFNDDGAGTYVGIGMIVGIRDDKIVVITPFENSPAAEAGIRAGDFILQVDGVPYSGPEMDKAVSLIRGVKGEPVTLTMERAGETYEVTVVRDSITIVNVESEMVTEDLGLIRLLQFSDRTAVQVEAELEALVAEGAKGIVLDLRGNPGGFLNEAVNIASLFLPEGKTVTYTLDKFDQKKVYPSRGGNYQDIPLVVLIDGASASASELVSAALKDYDRAVLVGQNTFGKGIVQMVYEVGRGGREAVKVTVSSYYSPNDITIHDVGVAPDVVVELPEDVQTPLTLENDTQLQEAIRQLRELLP